jgi:triacylglycerol esterase/lipase EstA (alpha/beta hydrolase family)
VKKAFIRTIVLFALSAIFTFSIIANQKKSTNIKSDSKLKLASGLPTQILFEENKGQTSQDVKFLSHGKGFNLFLTQSGAVFQLSNMNCSRGNAKIENQILKPCKTFSLIMKMFGANANTFMRGIDQAVTKSGYFIGNNESLWLDDINNFQTIEYQEIYQGINLLFHGSAGKLEYDFRLAPHADAGLIQLHFDGMKKVKIDRRNGDLIFKFGGNELRHQKPSAYQIVDGEKREVKARYVLLGKNRVGFELGKYDRERELIIDPVIYASYLGGTAGGDSVNDLAVDRNGIIYTASNARISFPETNSTYSDVMISKFDPSKPPNEQLLWVRYIGGAQDDVPNGIDVNADGNIYVTGTTYSPDFPMRFAEQSSHAITTIQLDHMAFVFKLHYNGDFHYGTFLGGGCSGTYTRNFGNSIVADSVGNAYVTGYTCSSNFPVRNGFQTSLQGTENAFLTKYDLFGHISYSTYFGNNFTYGYDVFTDGQGNAYLTGLAVAGLYTTSGAYRTSGGGFVAKFNTRNIGSNSIVYSTYIDTQAYSIAVDASGNAWAGTTGTIYKLNSAGSVLILSKSVSTRIYDIAIDQNGSIYYAGVDSVGNYKIVGVRPDGSLIDETAFPTGTGTTRINGVALGSEPGAVYVGGHTKSTNFPTSTDAYQPNTNVPNFPNSLSGQGFFAKVRLGVPQEREPLIFIPGIGGSTLYEADVYGNPIENLWMDGITQVLPYPTQKLSKLSLNPNDAPFTNVVPVDAVRDLRISGLNVFEVYGEFLENLRIQGNYTPRIGCSTQQTGEMPTLFIFPYDWRLTNANSAAKLKDLVDCVHYLYPTKKVNILSHSMGGLVARRYIIDHPNNHNVKKFISMVAPWLGAAKAIDSMYTGRFVGKFELGGGIYLYQNSVKDIVRFGAGPQELLPSAWYFTSGDRPFAFQSSYSLQPTEYVYTQAYEIMNSVFSSQPYAATANFHNNLGQDDWSSDMTGIKYYQLYGRQKCPNTIGQFVIRPSNSFPMSIRKLRFGSENKYTDGDGTVPVTSANLPLSMRAPNTLVHPYYSPNCREDSRYDHNGILGNEQFRAEILQILNDNSVQQFLRIKDESRPANSAAEDFTPDDLMNYLDITGVNRLYIADAQGNTNTPLGIADIGIQEISYEYGSRVGEPLVFPHEVTFSSGKIVDIKFQTSTDKIAIVNVKGFGRENAVEVVKYLDLQLPLGVSTWLKFTANGLESLRYDADGDGVFETEVQPTFHSTGASAKDRTPPNMDITFAANNNVATVTVNPTDTETGVNQIRYIVNDEISDHVYASPFTVNLTQSKLLYVSAEDNAGNRNLLAKWLDISKPNTTATQSPAPNINGWSKENVSVEIKSLDDLGGSGVESLTFSGSGAQTIPEETLSVEEIPFTFPQPSTLLDFLRKSLTINTEGITNLTFFARDKAGNLETTKTVSVKIDKTAPETTGNYAQIGSQMIVTLTSNDTLSGVEDVKYSINGGNLQTYTAPFAVLGTGNHIVMFFATDRAGNVEATKSLSFTIVVIDPNVTITSPASGSLYPVGATVGFTGNFTGDDCNSHTAIWTFDNISQAGMVSETTDVVTANYAFAAAGVYSVKMTVNNNCGGTGTADAIDGLTAMVVIYDPDGGFVTGGGWIDSPFGAYVPNPNLTGRASFGFNSKYQRGANVPTGNTEFQFRVADLNFKSTSYDWLVVGGAKAQYKGSGKINNSGNYGFMLTAIDGQINGGAGFDKFRIKIWDKITGNMIYDNQAGSSDNGNPTTIIGGGSIMIHR